MEFDERKSLRTDLLRKAYDIHFESNNMKGLVIESQDKERELACKYLEEKELLRLHSMHLGAGNRGYSVTAFGIDVIENNFDLTEM